MPEVVISVASTVRFSCGCGLVVRSATDAISHVLAKHHTMHAEGVLGPVERVTKTHTGSYSIVPASDNWLR